MHKNIEIEVISAALKEIVARDPAIDVLDQDALNAIAERMGRRKSTLCNWRSPNSDIRITAEAVRATASYLQALGADQVARDFIQKIMLNPIGMRLDSRGQNAP